MPSWFLNKRDWASNLKINLLILVIISSQIDQGNSLEYESGTLTQILYPSTPLHILADTHAEDAQISLTQTLTGFVNEPQIIYSVYRMNFENAVSGGYTFSITSQSPSSFTITVVAPTVQKIYNVWIKWLAFADRNKQVITEEIVTPQNVETFTETHFNKNFIVAVPIINYLSYTSSFTFKFDMPSVDPTYVQIVFTSTGVSQIGFQLLVAIKSPVYLFGEQQWAPVSSTLNLSPFQVSSVQIPPLQQSDNLNFPIFLGLTSDLTDQVNIEEISSSINPQLSFEIGSSTTCSVTSGWFNYMVISPQFQIPPLILQTFSQQEYYVSSGTQQISVELPLFKTTYTSTTDWIEIDNTFIGMQLVITTECLFKYKHDYWFLGSISDNQKYIQDYFYCSDGFNRMKYIINFTDGDRLEFKTIKFVFTPTSVEMYQQLDNINFDEEYRTLKIVISQVR
ncbi:unnamed protein product [Paramecium pentaurelia]|uniref:H-type lectin domain-containing protein n=1 Tax=Paramecium pentaurelia TaxID=43138 RepID=A0A8S1X1S4_9CILI|nr:unnamed protein product [Paramecium pentaurelia]